MFFMKKFSIHVDMDNTNMNSRGAGSGDTREVRGGSRNILTHVF